ncbi:MAG TPA: phage BR0599 family protein [Verrucomicrobiae bacterium]|jgi:uncharacterized phage protein (TIGR02218 family)|nr:phage BR0599 family protein [Verrucomicrobiae bacterium]
MNYLGRPIFQFPINWADPVNKSFSYDLREQSIGFSAEYFAALQQYTAQGYSFSVWQRSAADIAALDAFTAALVGRLNGFWLPVPVEAMAFIAATSSTSFSITEQGLSDTFASQPDQYLYFSVAGQTPIAARITSVTNNGDGSEQVVIDTAVAWLSSAVFIYRLNYVRLADDVEKGQFLAEGSQTRAFKVIELPLEYTLAETGQRKIFLYSISASSPVNQVWRFTNFAAAVISQNAQYAPFPMMHKSLRRGMALDGETLEIDARYDAGHPFSMFLPVPFARPVLITVSEIDYTDPDTQTVAFAGRILRVSDQGERVTAQCESFAYLLQNKIPGPMIGPDCPYHVYEPTTCKALRAKFETTATIASIDSSALPPTVAVTLDYPDVPQFNQWIQDDWFQEGWLETGLGVGYELRVITGSEYDADSGRLTLTLNVELVRAVVGQALTLVAGCDGQASTCLRKFNNYVNFGGFPGVPVVNPSLATFAANQAQGGKGK